MLLNDILRAEKGDEPRNYAGSPSESKSANAAVDQLFGQRTFILRTKLEVFTSELFDRLRIRSQNLVNITENQEALRKVLGKMARQVLYNMRPFPTDDSGLYRLVFDLETQKRGEQVECWRDVAQVMKDFLETWEALEQSKSRSIFLNNV
jgi:hypothetical protein